MHDLVTGIQQVGIGVQSAGSAKYLYSMLFGMDVLVFDDKAAATLMTRYTGDEVHYRHAILTMNLAGGGGFELWQFTSRTPAPQNQPAYGDIGIYAVKLKTRDIRAAHQHFQKHPDASVTALITGKEHPPHFWVTDTYGNCFQLIEGEDWFKQSTGVNGGVAGAVIGVTNLERSLAFYKTILGVDEAVYTTTSESEVPGSGSGREVRRAMLRKPVSAKGAFSRLLGGVQLELVEVVNGTPAKMFANRYWGDCGFIHLCFDVVDMVQLKIRCEASGYLFTVDSAGSFSMGTSAGRFCYVEDPDGTLIELVETHKIPIVKQWNLHLDLTKRKHQRPLPDWMIRMLGWSKVGKPSTKVS